MWAPLVLAEGESEAAGESSLEGVPPDQVDSVLAKLTDEQIRGLLIAELQKDQEAAAGQPEKPTGLNAWLRGWLHVLDGAGEDVDTGAARLLAHAPKVPADTITTLTRIGGGSGLGLVKYIFFIALILVVGFFIEFLFIRLTTKAKVQLPETGSVEEAGMNRLFGALINILPQVVHVTVFAFASVVLFILLGFEDQTVRSTFMAVLVALVLARGLTLVSLLICAPDFPSLRLLPLGNALATTMHSGIRFLIWYVALVLMFLTLLIDLGAVPETIRVTGGLLGSLLFILLAIRLLTRKTAIAEAILGEDDRGDIPWVRKQFAAFWHILAMLYLFTIWVIWITGLVSGESRDNGALFISLLIVPIYLVFDRIGNWLVEGVINTLGITRSADQEEEEKKSKAQGEYYISPVDREQRLRMAMTKAFRTFSVLVLTVWLLTLWGFEFPFAVNMVGAAFDILITLALALFIWRFASRYIERKILEANPDIEEEDEEEVDEFGGAKQRGRSYTLLPMLRKFVATTLLVMVTLIVLSSIGVDIGPLLAGAGVVGLAVGFGAQKLVTDVLSGFFYLLDDAFRVGEYIQAGSVSGAVEAITLRNVMLRHHRGMLQIVPHSELGSITNFMRGGIVVKFNLEFPYDTNIDQVRKIIKKVGQAMLKDEELGEDFILPVKSQGVREITNSVMVIRVKFTAHPGKQFVIQREAFRRITEALNAKGIFYAHRKVIVEVPQSEDKEQEEKVKQAVAAGAATGQLSLGGEEAPKEQQKGPEIPGM